MNMQKNQFTVWIILKYIGASCIIGFGLLISLGSLLSIGSQDSEGWMISDTFLFLILGILPTVLGIWLIVGMIRKNSTHKKNDDEKIILSIAKKYSGRLTAADLAMESDFSMTSAKVLLDEYVKQGFVELKISDSGVFVYEFHGIISEEERTSAQNIL
jgi:hypothetical protein